MRPTLLYRAYVAATRVVLPIAARIESRKLRTAGVAQERIREKSGFASLPRPDGRLIWFHAASVGESLSVLTLITRLGAHLRDAEFLITSGTATSAELVERRMPPRCRHQFAPLDAPGPLARFLSHWRPDAGIFVESELWPQMLLRSHQFGVPLALVNARLSERSLAAWRRRPDTARLLLSVFRLVLTQTEALAGTMVSLGADPDATRQGVNLKSMSAPLPIDADTVTRMQETLGARPVWVAASTHAGEEEIVLDAHARLLGAHPDLCLILVPRHPARGDEVADMVSGHGWACPRRSAGALPDAPVYLADTLGELGSWYALSDIVFLGGSLSPIGGHNPFEPAQAGLVILSGPHVANFDDTYAALDAANAVDTTPDAATIAARVDTYVSNPDARSAAMAAAKRFCEDRSADLDAMVARLITRAGACTMTDLNTVDVIAPNFKRRLSGVTATVARLVPLQARDIAITTCAPEMPDEVPNVHWSAC